MLSCLMQHHSILIPTFSRAIKPTHNREEKEGGGGFYKEKPDRSNLFEIYFGNHF